VLKTIFGQYAKQPLIELLSREFIDRITKDQIKEKEKPRAASKAKGVEGTKKPVKSEKTGDGTEKEEEKVDLE